MKKTMDKRFKILAVDDDAVNLELISSSLKDEYDILLALNGHDAISQLKEFLPDLILLDVMMSDLSGFDVCHIIKSDAAFAEIPIIFLTALNTKEGELRGLELGGIDYLTKPINFALLKLRVRNHIALKERNNLVKEQRDLLAQQKEELAQMLADLEFQNRHLRDAEEVLKKNERRMSSLFEISQYPFTSEQDFLDHALSEVITLTSSSIGYIYFYNEQKRQFTLNTWSKDVMRECAVMEQQTIYDLDSTGIWGEAVRQGKPILLNDYRAHNPLKKGVPEGHAPLRRFLTVPILVDGAIVAVVGVANKEKAYDEADVMQMTLFMDAVWKITAQKRAGKERAELETQLQQAQKMESVGRLAGGVAHDFNNLLTVILGASYLALMELDPDQPIHEYITSIQKAAEKSADLTQQLLAFARKQTIMPKVLDLNATVENMIKMLQRLIGEDIELKWQPEADLWPIKADPSQIDQILANLCVNARDSISDIGKITIRTGNSNVDEGYRAEHADFTPGEYVKISVCDNGCGMDKETQTQIFEPFFTTKGIGQGTGLGLATVYGAVRQNNGFINVYSEPGMGTTFTIYLPRYLDDCRDTARRAPAAAPAPRGLETILLVEDEPSILNMTTMILTKQGYTVLLANSPAEAVRLAGEQSGKIDLLITDVVMPDMNGKDLANNLMSLYSELKCLFMSGYTADVIAHHGVLNEGMNFIQKPFSLPGLANKVREVLDSDK